MGEGYGCSHFQCSTLANAIKFIHSCRRAAVVHQIRIFQYSIDRSHTNDCTQHHACFTCEVNGFVQIPYMRAVHTLHAHLPIAF